VGNGLAVQWTYVYQTAEGKNRAFEVSADGTVVSKNESDAMSDYGAYAGGYAAAYQAYQAQASGDATPLANWSWDSDAALASALKNETFRDAARAPNATLAEALGNDGVPDAWVFVASASEKTVIAMVNATSGAVAGVTDLSRYSWQSAAASMAAPAAGMTTASTSDNATPRASAPPVHLHEEGTLTATAPAQRFPFHLGAPEAGHLNLTMSPHGDVTGYGWSILQGTKQVTGESNGLTLFASSDTARGVTLGPGDYTLELTMSSAQDLVPLASVDYTVALDLASAAPR
jgi:hypothetical protein